MKHDIVQHAGNRGKTAPGRPFTPGQSGNPSGRPKRTDEEWSLILAARERAPEALKVLAEIMINGKTDADRLRAACALLDRAYGRPPAVVDLACEVKTEEKQTPEHIRELIEGVSRTSLTA